MPPPDAAQKIAAATQCLAANRFDDAEALLRQVIASDPDNHVAMAALARVALLTGRGEEAVELLRAAMALKPSLVEYRANLGLVLSSLGRLEEAIEIFQSLLEVRGDLPEVWNNLGVVLKKKGRLAEAEAAFRKAVAGRAGYGQALSNLGRVLQGRGKLDEALGALESAASSGAGSAEDFNHLGAALAEEERFEEALKAYDRALAIAPGYLEARWNRAESLLTMGRLAEGWPGYEARKKLKKVSQVGPFAEPEWGGEALGGKTILLHAEQGFGDTIQFVRYAPLVGERGGRVIVLCPRPLHRLLSGKLGIEGLVGGGDLMPRFDVQCALPSLPGVFGTTVETIPGREPYLAAEQGAKRRWAERVAREPGRMKVGLVWAGNPEHSNDPNRSIELAKLGPLAGGGDVTFFSLQKEAGAQQAQRPPEGMRLTDWTVELTDFAETAALVASLDVVISVDTAVVHLAGAMGKPVWVMLPRRADWRWMRGRGDSPWYPSARLFRQERRGEWGEVIDRVRTMLSAAC